MKVKCLALKPFLFHMTVLAVGELFSTTKGHATDLVADGLAKYAIDSDTEDLDDRAQDLADDTQLNASAGVAPDTGIKESDESAQDMTADKDQDASDASVVINEKTETQEKELTDDSDNAGSSEAPVAPVRKRRGSAPKSAD